MSASSSGEPRLDPTFEAFLSQGITALGLPLSEAQRRQMWAHLQLVVDTNRRFNLTRITSPADAAAKHYVDSLALLAMPGVSGQASVEVLDVGTGAGFPAVPLAIVCPQWRITAIDGTGKKARFVAEAASALGLRNLRALQSRAADLVRQQAEFDLVVLRAVMPLAQGLADTRLLLAPGASVVFYKTASITNEELAQGRRQSARYGLREMTHQIGIPSPDGLLERLLISYRRQG